MQTSFMVLNSSSFKISSATADSFSVVANPSMETVASIMGALDEEPLAILDRE